MFERVRAVARRVFMRAPRIAEPRRISTSRVAIGLAAGFASAAACSKYEPPRQVIPDVPVSAADAGIGDVSVEAAISEATGVPSRDIFPLGSLTEALKVNQPTRITVTLPAHVRSLMDTLKAEVFGARRASNGRSLFALGPITKDATTGEVSVEVTPLPGAYSREEGADNSARLLFTLGEGDEVEYALWYGLAVAGNGGGNGRDGGRRRDDAGTGPRDVARDTAPPPRDIATGEPRIRP